MPDLSRISQTTRIRDKGSELRSEHPPVRTWMTDKTRFCRETNATGLTRTSSGEKKQVNQLPHQI